MFKNLNTIFHKKNFILIFFLLARIGPYAQDTLIPLSQVKQEFEQKLAATQRSIDTVQVYKDHITRLIKRGNYRLADSILVATFDSFEQLNDTTLLLDIRKQRAFMYKVQRRFSKALEDYLWIKDYYEHQQNANDLVEINSLLAEYYRAIPDYILMEKHLNLAKQIINRNSIDKDVLALWTGRKGSWHTEYGGNNDSVQYYGRLSMLLAQESGETYLEALAANEIGFNFLNRFETQDSTLKYLYHSKGLLLNDERYRDYATTMNNIVRTINGTNPKEAVKILDFLIPLEIENDWYSALIQSLSHARYQYLRVGDKEKSDQAYRDILQARINEIQTQNEIKVNDLALTYQNQLTEKELDVQEQRTLLAEEEAKNNKRAFLITAIIAFSLSVISIIVFVLNQKFKKQNELLDRRSKEIENANSELERSLLQQKILFKELNHRVKNNLSILTGLIYLQETGEPDKKLKNSLANLRTRIKSMALAHESLYSSEKSDKIILADYLEAIVNDVKQALGGQQKLSTQIKLPPFEMSLQQSVPLGMIMNELITNSIKHGFKDCTHGTIIITGSQKESGFVIDYRDNGSGYNPEEKGNIGLKLIRLLLEQLTATLEDKSSEKGFWVELRFPPTILQ